MTLEEIKSAVDTGKTVHWSNERYIVVKDVYGEYYITDKYNGFANGLVRRDTGKMVDKEEDFYIGE